MEKIINFYEYKKKCNLVVFNIFSNESIDNRKYHFMKLDKELDNEFIAFLLIYYYFNLKKIYDYDDNIIYYFPTFKKVNNRLDIGSPAIDTEYKSKSIILDYFIGNFNCSIYETEDNNFIDCTDNDFIDYTDNDYIDRISNIDSIFLHIPKLYKTESHSYRFKQVYYRCFKSGHRLTNLSCDDRYKYENIIRYSKKQDIDYKDCFCIKYHLNIFNLNEYEDIIKKNICIIDDITCLSVEDPFELLDCFFGRNIIFMKDLIKYYEKHNNRKIMNIPSLLKNNFYISDVGDVNNLVNILKKKLNIELYSKNKSKKLTLRKNYIAEVNINYKIGYKHCKNLVKFSNEDIALCIFNLLPLYCKEIKCKTLKKLCFDCMLKKFEHKKIKNIIGEELFKTLQLAYK